MIKIVTAAIGLTMLATAIGGLLIGAPAALIIRGASSELMMLPAFAAGIIGFGVFIALTNWLLAKDW